MKLAGVDIGNQSGDGVSDGHCVVQAGQRIQSDTKMTILLPPNPAQFHGLVGIGMKETQSALGGRGLLKPLQPFSGVPDMVSVRDENSVGDKDAPWSRTFSPQDRSPVLI